jgi:hypothetical protein
MASFRFVGRSCAHRDADRHLAPYVDSLVRDCRRYGSSTGHWCRFCAWRTVGQYRMQSSTMPANISSKSLLSCGIRRSGGVLSSRQKLRSDILRNLRSRIGASVRESIGSHRKEELRLYGRALSQWSEPVVRKLEMLINSYADAYRMQIHRINGTSDAMANPDRLQADWELVKSWRPASAADLTDAHA